MLFCSAFTTDVLVSEGGAEPDRNSVAGVSYSKYLHQSSWRLPISHNTRNVSKTLKSKMKRKISPKQHPEKSSPALGVTTRILGAHRRTGISFWYSWSPSGPSTGFWVPNLSALLHGENFKAKVQAWIFFCYRASRKTILQARTEQVSVLAAIRLLLFLAESHYAVFSKIVNVLSGSQWETTLICITGCEIKCAALLLPLICLPFISALGKNYKKTELQIFLLNFFTFNPLFGS